MEIKDGDPMHYAHCKACGVICISNSEGMCSDRALEHLDARGAGHNTMTSTIGFTEENLPSRR